MNMSDMGGDTGAAGVDATALVLRLVLLLATTSVTGIGVCRQLLPAVPRRLVLVTWFAGAVAAASALLSLLLLPVDPLFAVAHLVLALAIPVLLRRAAPAAVAGYLLAAILVGESALGQGGLAFLADSVYTLGVAAWFGLTAVSRLTDPAAWTSTRFRPVAVAQTIAVSLALAGVVRLLESGIGFDERVVGSASGLALLAAVFLPLAATVLTGTLARGREAAGQWRGYPAGAAVLVVAFLVSGAVAAMPRPATQPSGVPLLGRISLAGQGFPVLVSPQRPGRNLVHFPDSAGPGLVVRGADGVPVLAEARPGSAGIWAEVTLPGGRSELTVGRATATDTVRVDTGSASGPAGAVGADGPECASAALGELVAGRHEALTGCPADGLTGPDADALRSLVNFLASNGVPAITIDTDPSPRATQAADLVRAAAADHHVPVAPDARPNGALVVLSGWSAAPDQLTVAADLQRRQPAYDHGIFLAPWLLTAPVVDKVVSSAIPLRFDPREERSLRYTTGLGSAFGGELASPAGFTGWLAAQQDSIAAVPVRMYATAQVDAMPMDGSPGGMAGMAMDGQLPGQWIPGSTVVGISAPLAP